MTETGPGDELLEPRAEDLAEALRAFGYDLPTALADLVDNSIAAGARTVRVEYSSDPGSAWLALVDDGRGMDESKLRSAMRFASNPGDLRAAGDLGRFGLGLKTASLSQARKLTVLSRDSSGALAAMTWDLDYVRQQRRWLVLTHADPEAVTIADLLGFSHQGTMVLWRRTDKLGEGPEMQRRVTDAGRELSLLFHKYIASGRLTLRIARLTLDAMDPYLRRNPLAQDRGFETLEHDGQKVRANPVVLPHPSRLTRQESLLASGPGGMLARQGFYVYRGDRLVVAGSWLDLPGMHNTTYTRLARIALEILPDADLAWKIDVRKSTVRPPAALVGRLAELAEDVRTRSEQVFTHRGAPVRGPRQQHDIQAVWQQVRRLGRTEYIVNREHPLVAAVLAGHDGPAVAGLIKMIEATLPADLISSKADALVPPADDQTDANGAEEVLSAFRAMLAGLPSDPGRRAVLAEALAAAEPFSRFPGLVREVIDSEEC